MECKLAAINVYPVKSLGGIGLDQALATRRGIEGDRRWILTDDQGKFLSQRSHPALALVKVSRQSDGLLLRAPAMEPFVLRPSEQAARRTVTIWRDTVEAAAGPETGSAWFSSYLSQGCQVSFMDDACQRPVDLPAHLGQHQVSFADGFPCLVISTASLDLLNSKLEIPVPMDRFRTNLVVSGCAPHAEDAWQQFRLGEAAFRAVRPCSRCRVPTIDQESGQAAANQEPLRTLATYRTQPGGVMFGINLIVEKEGRITVGDAVVIDR